MKKGLIASVMTLLMMAPTASWAISIGYDIGPYRTSGYSASWAHSAGGSPYQGDLDLNGDGSLDTLYMSPGREGRKFRLTGMLFGEWDGTVMSGITGMLNGTAVTGGSLGGAYYSATMDPLWYLDISSVGRFFFEEINGTINQITEDYLLLWGQNEAAYGIAGCDQDECDNSQRWGLDLYGKAKSLPEPGMFLLMVLGLISTVVVSRRRELRMERKI